MKRRRSPRLKFRVSILAAEEKDIAGRLDELSARLGALRERGAKDDEARERATALGEELERARTNAKLWSEINEAIGSASGDKFRRFAQAATLQHLVALANQRLALLAPRYALERSGDAGSLGLQIIDRDLGDERRSTRSLSGGERFLASLALALALAGLEGRDSFVDTLFIDEGFGALEFRDPRRRHRRVGDAAGAGQAGGGDQPCRFAPAAHRHENLRRATRRRG